MLIVGSNVVSSSKIPVVTALLLFVTLAFFVKSFSIDIVAENGYRDGKVSRAAAIEQIQDHYDFWGFQISDIQNGEFHSVFSNVFVHSGLMHFIGNMLAFWAFAIALEEIFGGVGFFVFYMATGAAACITQGLFLMGSDVPIVGASGSVAAMMAAYAVLFGLKGKVKVLVWYYPFVTINVPAPVFAGLWVFPQMVELSEHGVSDGGGVALVSHVAGFAIGAAVGVIMKSKTEDRISSHSDGSVSVQSDEHEVVKSDKELLDEILACRPFTEVIETLGDDCRINCPQCGSSLDLRNTISDRLVKCDGSSCGKMVLIDGELLASHL